MENNNKKIFIGIDVSKEPLDISYSGKHYKIKNQAKDIFVFIKTKISLAFDWRFLSLLEAMSVKL
jgi:hypothetical protein